MDEEILKKLKKCNSQNAENAFIALKERLYIDMDYDLFRKLLRTIQGNSISGNDVGIEVLLKHNNEGKAVAVATYDPYDISGYSNIQIFVASDHRKKGIGKELLNNIKEMFPQEQYNVGLGVDGSGDFWHKTGMGNYIFNDKSWNNETSQKSKRPKP